MNATTDTILTPEYTGGVNIFRGLMWRHWLAGRWVIFAAMITLLTGGWALMLFHHPGWIIATGSLLAILAGLVFGGSDVSDGSEEFAFALPPTRSQRYLSGLILGGGTVLAFCLIGTLSLAFSLPQYAWSLVVDSGFTTPFGPWGQTYLYFMAVVVPLSVFACTFAVESGSRTRGGMWWSWIPAVIITGLTVWLTALAEVEMWGDVNGYISILTLLALTAMILLFGHTKYVRKEGISQPGRSGASGGGVWWIWIIMAIVVAVFIFMAMFWHVASDSSYEEQSAINSQNESMTASRSIPAIPASPATAQDHIKQEEDLARENEAEARALHEAKVNNARAREVHSRSTPKMGIAIAGIVPLLLVVVLVVFILALKRRPSPMRLRGPRRRHIVTRSVCAVLALAILISVGYFSWTEAGAIYATESPQTGTVQIPTKTPAALTTELKPNQRVTLDKGRLLIKAIVLEAVTPTTFRAVHVDEFDITWPGGNSGTIANSFKFDNGTLSYRFDIADVYLKRHDGAAKPALQIDGNWSMKVRRQNGNGRSSNSSGGRIIVNGIGGGKNINSGNTYRSNKPLSAIPSSAAYGQLIICLFAELGDPDDKLTTISTEKFIAGKHEQILAETNRSGGGYNRRWRVDPDVPPGISLIEHVGMAGALLALAAVLMAQLFMRRGLATVAMLATVILYIAAIDRAALDMHISHAQDADAPIGKRLAACGAASNTFFYAKTAAAQLQTIADDKQTPKPLKYRSARNARLLNAIAITPTRPLFPSGISSSSTTLDLPMHGEDRHDSPQWEVYTFRRNSDQALLMVVMRMPPRHSGNDQLDDPRMLWRIITSQADPTGKIVILAPSLKAIVVGEEPAMRQAAWAIQHGQLAKSKVWKNLIRPTAKTLQQPQN